jgi:hypothetical protein
VSEYFPDKWVIVELIQDDGSKELKVLASWYGGFTGSNSWKLSSGITNTEIDESGYEFLNYSGSKYFCHKNTYGMSGYTSMIYSEFVNKIGDRIRVLTEEELEKLNA